MSMGLIGRKCGMTRVFTDAGASIPVTVVEIAGNRVTAIKDGDSDGYRAVQVTTGDRRASRVGAPLAGQFKKAGVSAGRGVWEFRLDDGEALPKTKTLIDAPAPESAEADGEEGDQAQAAEPQYEEADIKIGDELTAALFESGQVVDVTGRSIGKGFAGTIKRHNFSSQRMSHGNSLSHRAPGSIGQNQTPGHVFKGKKMAGQMGNVRRTVQNLEIVRVDVDKGILLIRGGVPGAKGSDLIIRPAVKQR